MTPFEEDPFTKAQQQLVGLKNDNAPLDLKNERWNVWVSQDKNKVDEDIRNVIASPETQVSDPTSEVVNAILDSEHKDNKHWESIANELFPMEEENVDDELAQLEPKRWSQQPNNNTTRPGAPLLNADTCSNDYKDDDAESRRPTPALHDMSMFVNVNSRGVTPASITEATEVG